MHLLGLSEEQATAYLSGLAALRACTYNAETKEFLYFGDVVGKVTEIAWDVEKEKVHVRINQGTTTGLIRTEFIINASSKS